MAWWPVSRPPAERTAHGGRRWIVSELRYRLVATFRGGDQQMFVDLCRHNAETIVREFNSWTVVPEEIRHDQRAVGEWAQAMFAVAEVLRALGHPDPMERLMPSGAANPINR